MKHIIRGNDCSRTLNRIVARALIVAGFLFAVNSGLAQFLPPGSGTNSSPTYTPLNSWSFNDTTNWTSDNAHAPISFTNISSALFGDDMSLMVNTNLPAWLQFNIVEKDNMTNLTFDQGSVVFWFAPAWAGTNAGGSGPGLWGRLIEAGGYAPDASFGWWSLYVDDVGANLYFTVQPGDGSTTTYLTTPISWSSNFWHCVALTYSATNTALYVDGSLTTNGPGITAWPGTNVLAGGFYIGSDSNGVMQAQGYFDDLYTYNVPLDSDTVYEIFDEFYPEYYLNPWNWEMMPDLISAPSNPSTNTVTPDVITGQGNLMVTNLSDDFVYGTNQNQVWITNLIATATGTNVNVTFTIEGGANGYYYDVFVGTILTSPLGNGNWSWQGQAQRRQQCSLTGLPQGTIFFILGSPQDSDTNGLTDAYELLITHTNPNVDDQNGAGIPNGWQVLLGLNPLVNQVAQPSTRANYGYTMADWLNGVGGIKNGTNSLDAEGNVLQVSQ